MLAIIIIIIIIIIMIIRPRSWLQLRPVSVGLIIIIISINNISSSSNVLTTALYKRNEMR